MPYNYDMSDEKKPSVRKLLPEGWQSFTVSTCEEATSKAGNPMFIVELTHEETSSVETIYLVAVQGKRWMLKKLLAACGVEAAKDGVYDWDIPDVLNKKIRGLVEHEDNEWINREGETVKTKQNRITDFEALAWDEN